MDNAEELLRPIAEDKNLPAIEKIQRFFSAGSRWKTDRKSFMLDLLRVWYTDANALVRQKQETTTLRRLEPMLTEIVCQGIAEGVMSTTYPEQDALPADALQRLEAIMGAYAEAMERILGAPAGSLPLVDTVLLKEWVTPPTENKKS